MRPALLVWTAEMCLGADRWRCTKSWAGTGRQVDFGARRGENSFDFAVLLGLLAASKDH
jgi:hypothetical protein